MGGGDQGGVVVPVEPGGLVVMVQSEPGFQFPVVALDAPSDRTCDLFAPAGHHGSGQFTAKAN